MSMLSAAVVSTETALEKLALGEDSKGTSSLGEHARRAAKRRHWKRATVFQLAHIHRLGGEGGEVAPRGTIQIMVSEGTNTGTRQAVWFRARFRLLRWQLSARDWSGAGDTLDELIPVASRRFPQSAALLGWLSLSRAVVHYQIGRGDRFRRTLATVLWFSRHRGPGSLGTAASGLARIERARQLGRRASRAAPAAESVPTSPCPVLFNPAIEQSRIGWHRLLELWTGPLSIETWVGHEQLDIDPDSLSDPELAAIKGWIARCEADVSQAAAAWQVPGLARRLEAGSSRLDRALRLRLLAAWRGVTARVQEPYPKAVALVALSEMALWCADSGSDAQVGLRVAELRADLGLAAGLFRRLGLHARAATCEEQWALLTRLKIASSHAESKGEESRSGGEAEALWPLPSSRGRTDLSRATVRRKAAAVGFVTRDEVLLRELGRLLVLSQSPLPVLVGGESGTGKEVIARAIHQWSSLDGEFVAIHCGAIPRELLESELFGHTRGAFTGAAGEKPGLVEVADGGTLFLDEIGEMGAEAQMKLLRVLESGEVRRVGDTRVRKVQVRIVAATHRDLPSLVASREFRLDLYHRIRGLDTRLSPLRFRRHDIAPLALHLLRPLRGRAALRLSDAAVGRLLAYDWPGNVRELKAVLLRAAYLSLALGSSVIEPETLGLPLAEGAEQTFRPVVEPGPDALDAVSDDVAEFGLERTLERMERRIITQALDDNSWNRTRTAASLGGLSRTTLLSKMKRLGISEPLANAGGPA